MFATTSMALASRLCSGLNSVTSPVNAGTAAVGQAERSVVMPPLVSISPRREQPASARRVRPAMTNLEGVTGIPCITGLVSLALPSPRGSGRRVSGFLSIALRGRNRKRALRPTPAGQRHLPAR
jgi:hypothetical protein